MKTYRVNYQVTQRDEVNLERSTIKADGYMVGLHSVDFYVSDDFTTVASYMLSSLVSIVEQMEEIKENG